MKSFHKFFVIIFLFLVGNSFAFAPEEYLPEPQEQRARELFVQIKCPVCAGQMIESSDAAVALEMRKLVREQIKQGKSDEEIKSYLVANYGDDILTSENLNKNNFIIYLLPIIFVVTGSWFLMKKLSKAR